MGGLIRNVDPHLREYAHDYAAGWNVSQRAAVGALERADGRDVSHAWYDGYDDYACGRAKWTYRAWRRRGCDATCADACGERGHVPGDFPVRPIAWWTSAQQAGSPVTCGECGRTWDDAVPTSWTPAPSARCPFEHFH